MSGLEKRFDSSEWSVTDKKTGLMWVRDAGVSEFPLTWKEAFSFIDTLNRQEYAGHGDWRLPNRRELFSLVSHDRVNPPLLDGKAFINVFHGYYWTASTCARLPDQAWYSAKHIQCSMRPSYRESIGRNRGSTSWAIRCWII